MFRFRWFPLLLGLLCAGIGLPAEAAKGSVALVPAHVFKGSQDNGRLLDAAMRDSLGKAGYSVLPAGAVDAAMRAQKMDLSKPQYLRELTALGAAVNADFVVYPRIQSVGMGANAQRGEYQATCIVNVVSVAKKQIVHTNQLGQEFKAAGAADAAVMDRGDAAEAAGKLLAGFYKKDE